MPTFKPCVFKQRQRKDGRYRVSIRVIHNRKVAYLPTDVYVLRKQIAPDFSCFKDADITRKIDRDILKYEKILLNEFGSNLNRFSTKEIISYIEKYSSTEGGANIDFIAFSRDYTARFGSSGPVGYLTRFNAVIRALIDFFRREQVFIKEINSKNLKEFSDFLQTERQMTRINQFGNEYTIIRKPVKTQTVADYLRIIQTLFNAACDEFNPENEETALITHNPFKKQLVKVTDSPEKRNLSVNDLIKIIKYDAGSGREGLARDVFLLSFYMGGINTVDIFNIPVSALVDGRLTYHRQKTASRRRDKALFSIRIEPEAQKLLKQYRDPSGKRAFKFYHMYTNDRIFNTNVNKGCKQLAKSLEITPQLSSYYARHTLATIGSVDCKISEGDIALLLNHVGDASDRDKSKNLRVTKGYIGRSTEKVDQVNRKILNFIKKTITQQKD